LNVTRQAVSKWESGSSFPDMETLLQLCSILDTTPDRLLLEIEEQPPRRDDAREGTHRPSILFLVTCGFLTVAFVCGVILMTWGGGYGEAGAWTFLLSGILLSLILVIAWICRTASVRTEESQADALHAATHRRRARLLPFALFMMLLFLCGFLIFLLNMLSCSDTAIMGFGGGLMLLSLALFLAAWLWSGKRR